MKALKLAAAIWMLTCTACSYLRWHEAYGPDHARVRELAPVQQALQSADEASPHFILTDIGRVVYADFEAPFWYAAYRPFRADLKRVLILGGARGDAIAGVDYIVDLIRILAAAAPESFAYDLDILPILNPWGYVFDLPLNRRGVEIEGDFSSFDSSEARIIRRFLREKQYDLIIDLQEDPDAAGFLVWQYGLADENVSTRVVRNVRSGGFPVESGGGLLLSSPRNGIVAASLWQLTLLRLSRRLNLAGYARQNVSALVYTVVTPQRLPLAERIAMQRLAVDTLLDAYRESP